MKDLSIRPETIKLLGKKNVRKKLINIGGDFLYMIPKVQTTNQQMGLHQA